ncbi:hypothetical protein ASD08_05155 [Streptomyces sp. Root369]|nr:hypothetical protein ASD08_05155 [Streptomyces sp. Root369]
MREVVTLLRQALDAGLEDRDCLVTKHAGHDLDATLLELLGPVLAHGALVEAGELFHLGTFSGDDQTPDSGPHRGATTHGAGAPVDDQFKIRVARGAEVPCAQPGLREGDGDDLGVGGGET